ncbi:hypothetical protein KAT51_02245 [bacterium]|nr:hypothetical protein [bacterium]
MGNVSRKPIRSLWHLLGGLFLPTIYYFTNRKIALGVFAIFFIFFFLIDFLRLCSLRLNEWIFRHLKTIIREEERNSFSGNPYYILGAFLSVLLFEKGIAIASLCFVACGDLAASIIGKRYGRIKIKKKSLEGGLGSLLACLLIGIILLVLRLKLSFGILFIGALTASIVELFSPGRKDNLTIPLFSGLIMQIVGWV